MTTTTTTTTTTTVGSYNGEGARGGRTMRLQHHRGAIKRTLDRILGVRTKGCCSVGSPLMVRANGIGWSACASRATVGGQAPIRDSDGRALVGVINYTEAYFLDPTDGNVYRAAIWAPNRDADAYVGTLARVS